MKNGASTEFLDVSLAAIEFGIQARTMGMSQEQCSTLAFQPLCVGPEDSCLEDLCFFGWAVEDAFRTAGLDECVVSAGSILVVRSERLVAAPMNPQHS